MLYHFKKVFICALFLIVLKSQGKPKLLVVLGSERDYSVSKKLAHVIEELVDTSRFDHEIIDLQNIIYRSLTQKKTFHMKVFKHGEILLSKLMELSFCYQIIMRVIQA
jgi:hypothetical protein